MSYPDNTSPASGAAAVTTPSDDSNIAPTRGVYVGTTGTLKVMMINGDVVTFSSIAAGVVHPLQIVRIYETGTNADNIVALY
jgi:hypothetical protein